MFPYSIQAIIELWFCDHWSQDPWKFIFQSLKMEEDAPGAKRKNLNTCFGPCNKFILSTMMYLTWKGRPEQLYRPECSHDQRGNKNTIKSAKHTKTCYFEVSTTFLSYFYLFWSFSPSSEHFQAKMGPNLDLVWYEILEFAWSLRHLNIIIII